MTNTTQSPWILSGEKKKVQKALVPAGTHIARCYSCIDLGTHDSEYMGKAQKKREIQFTFEFPENTHVFSEEKGPQPMVISKSFPYSFHPDSNMRKFLESWLGRPFTPEESTGYDITKFVGKGIYVTVIHNISKGNGLTYDNITTGMPVPKGLEVAKQVNPSLVYSPYTHDDVVFSKLSPYIQDKIKASDEMKNVGQKPNMTETIKSGYGEENRPKIESVPF